MLRHPRENKPNGRSFEERPSGGPASFFVPKPLDSRFRGNDTRQG